MSEIISANGNNDGHCIITGGKIRKPIFYESMTKITDKESGISIRVWRTQKECPEYADADVLAIFKCVPGGATVPELLDILSSIEGVSAVEVVDRDGLGAVAYFEW